MDIKTLFNQYYVDIIKNHYFDYQGTANRPTFWYFFLFNFVILFAAGFIFGLFGLPFLAYLVALAILCPYFCLAMRRLRDAGFPEWMVVGLIIPLVNLVVLVLLAMPTKTAK